MEKVGVRTLNSQDVEKRLAEYVKLQETIRKYTILKKFDVDGRELFLNAEAKITMMVDGIFEINDLLMRISGPWGSAGSEFWFAEVMSAWKVIYTRILNVATVIQGMLNEDFKDETDPETRKMELVNEFYQTLYQLDYLAYAQFGYTLSWRRDDVANKWALTLYQPPMPSTRPGEGLNTLRDPNRDIYEAEQ